MLLANFCTFLQLTEKTLWHFWNNTMLIILHIKEIKRKTRLKQTAKVCLWLYCLQTSDVVDWEFFRIDNDYYLAAASLSRHVGCTVYRLDKVRKQFDVYQHITNHRSGQQKTNFLLLFRQSFYIIVMQNSWHHLRNDLEGNKRRLL